MQPESHTEEPGFFDMLASKYNDIWKSIILPKRRDYCIEMLGPGLHRVDADLTFRRRDGVAMNVRGERICLSYFELCRVDQRQRLSSKCLLYLHTHGANRLEGLCLAKQAAQLGLNFCCFDFAGSGKSEGRFTTLGVRESDDCRAVMHYLQTDCAVESFVLWGRSMGAVTAILTCAGKKLPVDCMVLDSPFADVELLVRDAGNSYIKLGGYFAIAVFSFVRDDIKQQLGHDLGNLRPLDSCRDCEVPCIFVAAKDDQLVPLERVREMFEQIKTSSKWFFEVEGTHSSERKTSDIQLISAQIRSLIQQTQRQPSASIPYTFEVRDPNLQLLPADKKTPTIVPITIERKKVLKQCKSEQVFDINALPFASKVSMVPDRLHVHGSPPVERSGLSIEDPGCLEPVIEQIEMKQFLAPLCEESKKNIGVYSDEAIPSNAQSQRFVSQFRGHGFFNKGERRLMATLGPKILSTRPVLKELESIDVSGEISQRRQRSPIKVKSPLNNNDHTNNLARKIEEKAVQISNHQDSVRNPAAIPNNLANPINSLNQRATRDRTLLGSKRSYASKMTDVSLAADHSALQHQDRSTYSIQPMTVVPSLKTRPKPQIFSPEKQSSNEQQVGRIDASRSKFEERPKQNLLASKLITLQTNFCTRGVPLQSKENSPSSVVWSKHAEKTVFAQQPTPAVAKYRVKQAMSSRHYQMRDNPVRIFDEQREYR